MYLCILGVLQALLHVCRFIYDTFCCYGLTYRNFLEDATCITRQDYKCHLISSQALLTHEAVVASGSGARLLFNQF